MKYDVERLIDDTLAIVKSNLNDKLDEIQNEKDTLLGDDNFNLPRIDDKAYFDSLDDKVANFNEYVYYGVGDNAVIEIASAEASEVSLFFTVVLHYDGDDRIYRKMLRYIRALQEIVSENFGEIPECSNFKVATISPADLKDLDGDTFHKIGGISISSAIA